MYKKDTMLNREQSQEKLVAQINLEGCPEGDVLQPLEPRDEITEKYFSGWETPLAPWGGPFPLNPGLAVVIDEGRPVLEWTIGGGSNWTDRTIVTNASDWRDYSVAAEIKPIDVDAKPHLDRADRSEALIGIVFRVRTSRNFYLFGIEGKRRAVLYRRSDDEWFVLAEQEVEVPDAFVKLELALDGDGIRCKCEELGVDLFCTDTTYREGTVGVRAVGLARLSSLQITRTPSQEARDENRRRLRMKEEQKRTASIPDPVLVRTLDLEELGTTQKNIFFSDFAQPGRHDMLISYDDQLKAMSIEGETLWQLPFNVKSPHGIVFSEDHTENGRLIYGFTSPRLLEKRPEMSIWYSRSPQYTVWDEMIVIQGKDGKVVARVKVPLSEDPIPPLAFSTMTGNFTGSGSFDIVLRYNTNGGSILWAYDRGLNLLWESEVKTPYGHGRAIWIYDVDGDGRDEILAGGTLYSPDGHVIWTHDLEAEMAEIPGAGHYDAVTIGSFAGDESVDPVAFLVSGSAGVYVVDGLTGRTRMVHRVGHAQGFAVGKVRNDIPGQQILVVTRWGNMGILDLLSGHGDRLWREQPDYAGQGSVPVTWGDEEQQLIWMNTSGSVQSLYNGHGRIVKDLPELQRLWGNRMSPDVHAGVERMGDDPRELICITVDGKMYAFGPED